MTIEKVKETWLKHYEENPDSDLDVGLQIHLLEQNDEFWAYYGTLDGYNYKIPIKNIDDISEGLKTYLQKEF